MDLCVFCKIITGELTSHKIAENDDLVVIQDINPKASIHYLIIPKKHIQDIQAMENRDFFYGGKILSMAHHLSQTIPDARDFKLHCNSGKNAGQIVMHLHVHFLAGKVSGTI